MLKILGPILGGDEARDLITNDKNSRLDSWMGGGARDSEMSIKNISPDP